MSRNFDAGAGTRNEARRRQEEEAAREAAARNRRLERESGIEKEQGELHIVVVTVLRSGSRSEPVLVLAGAGVKVRRRKLVFY